MSTILNGYHITYRIGADFAEVRAIDHIDEFGGLVCSGLVFRGDWNECIAYAEANYN